MEYMNIHVSSIDSFEFKTATPNQQATWLKLLRYCCGQENGGCIDDAASLQDRDWQSMFGCTLEEVKGTSKLWSWSGTSLEVEFYPTQAEKETKAKRKGGIIGNRRRWGKKNHSDSHSESQTPQPSESLSDSHSESITKRNETKLNEMEGAPPRIITLEAAQKFFSENGSGYSADQVREQWLYYDAMRNPADGSWQKPSRTGAMFPISDWRSELSAALVKFAAGRTGIGSEKNGGEVSASVSEIARQKKIAELESKEKALMVEMNALAAGYLEVPANMKKELKSVLEQLKNLRG